MVNNMEQKEHPYALARNLVLASCTCSPEPFTPDHKNYCYAPTLTCTFLNCTSSNNHYMNYVTSSWVWAMLILTLYAAPTHHCSLSSTGTAVERGFQYSHTAPYHVFGESPVSRAGYTIVSLVCVFVLAAMIGIFDRESVMYSRRTDRIGYRTRYTRRSQIPNFTFTHYLIFVLYFFSMAFVLSAALLVSRLANPELSSYHNQETGLGLSYPSACKIAIEICLVFYVGSKVIMHVPKPRTN